MSPREYCAHRRIPAFLRSQPVPQPGDLADGLRVRKPYALSICKIMARQGSFFPRPTTYTEMARSVRVVYPLLWLPKEKEFLVEFGIGLSR